MGMAWAISRELWFVLVHQSHANRSLFRAYTQDGSGLSHRTIYSRLRCLPDTPTKCAKACGIPCVASSMPGSPKMEATSAEHSGMGVLKRFLKVEYLNRAPTFKP